ncbi:MAG: polyprenyl synthetase family protein [Johnsonella sp.]|nr:polyprenyl synthetase family protein [Johnsonella sp.]
MGLNYDISDIENAIEKFLPSEGGFQQTLVRAMRESVLSGGKRVRPMLMYEAYRLFAGRRADMEELAPFMAAIEMIHTSSLIHDDLPCMDNDILRRGKPTTWVSYGEDMAVLAGDALIIEAFEIMALAAGDSEDIEKFRRCTKAIKILSQKTGIRGMIGGQVLDVEKTGQPLSGEELDFIYRLKTAALLEASMTMGAVMGGADEKELEKIEEIANSIGLAFQIQDDVLDETASEEELGKSIHSDEKNAKTTYVRLYGPEHSRERVKELSFNAKSLLEGIITEKGRECEDYSEEAYYTLADIIDWLTMRVK